MRIVPLVLLTLFALADALANWHLAGMRSVSEQVWTLEGRYGWWAYSGLLLVCCPLLAHLFLRWPYGP